MRDKSYLLTDWPCVLIIHATHDPPQSIAEEPLLWSRRRQERAKVNDVAQQLTSEQWWIQQLGGWQEGNFVSSGCGLFFAFLYVYHLLHYRLFSCNVIQSICTSHPNRPRSPDFLSIFHRFSSRRPIFLSLAKGIRSGNTPPRVKTKGILGGQGMIGSCVEIMSAKSATCALEASSNQMNKQMRVNRRSKPDPKQASK